MKTWQSSEWNSQRDSNTYVRTKHVTLTRTLRRNWVLLTLSPVYPTSFCFDEIYSSSQLGRFPFCSAVVHHFAGLKLKRTKWWHMKRTVFYPNLPVNLRRCCGSWFRTSWISSMRSTAHGTLTLWGLRTPANIRAWTHVTGMNGKEEAEALSERIRRGSGRISKSQQLAITSFQPTLSGSTIRFFNLL